MQFEKFKEAQRAKKGLPPLAKKEEIEDDEQNTIKEEVTQLNPEIDVAANTRRGKKIF